MKLRLIRQETPSDTWKTKTLNPKSTYIIKDGKCYKVPKDEITPRKDICTDFKLRHYLGGSLGLPIESLPEVK